MTHESLWREWSFDPGIVVPLVISAVLFALGSDKAAKKALFWSGWLILILALLSPLHELGEALFSAHMVQHEVLMLAAAPLLVLSRPLVPMLRGVPMAWRKTLGRWSKTPPIQGFWKTITQPQTAWWIHAAALWIWHYPPLFDATLDNGWIHAAQHLSFFASALLFWWALFFARGRNSYGIGLLYIFTTAVHTGILGALLTLSTRPWYPAYQGTTAAWGLNPLEDQQLGGLIMWVPASLVYLAAGLTLFAGWLKNSGAAPVLGLCVSVFMIGCANNNQSSLVAGQAAIQRYGCGSCHTIPGVPGAAGLVGPPLAGIGKRMYIAGELLNRPDNLTHWIAHPRSVNEKTAMPELGVTARDAGNIAEFLYSLK